MNVTTILYPDVGDGHEVCPVTEEVSRSTDCTGNYTQIQSLQVSTIRVQVDTIKYSQYK